MLNEALGHKDVRLSGSIVYTLLISALDGDEGKETLVTILDQTRWAPEPIWMPWRREKYLSFIGYRTPITRPSNM
jgi:hypothetical protein